MVHICSHELHKTEKSSNICKKKLKLNVEDIVSDLLVTSTCVSTLYDTFSYESIIGKSKILTSQQRAQK